MKQTLLIESHFWPSIHFWSTAYRSSHIILEQHQYYKKRSYTNKCKILAANGPLLLIVPLKRGKHHNIPINDVFISNAEDWKSRHLKTLQSAYGSSPFFEHYIAEITNIYMKDWERISELNLAIIEWIINEFLSSFPEFSISPAYTEDLDESIYDLRDVFSPRLSHQIHIKPYNQVYEYKFGFTKDLSCLDLIFNTGPAFGQYI